MLKTILTVCFTVMTSTLVNPAFAKQVQKDTFSQKQTSRLEKSVVKLNVYIDGNYAGHGTGWYVKKNRIVTNYHVVGAFLSSPGSHVEVKAKLKNQQKEFVVSEMLSFDPLNDAVVLKTKTEAAPLALADPKKKLTVGDRLFVIGNPGDRQFVLQSGAIASLDKKFQEPLGERTNLELELEVKGGSSGSPVFNKNGEVVSMVMGGAEGVKSGLCLDPSTLRKVLQAAEKAKPQTLREYADAYLKKLGSPGDEVTAVDGKLECKARQAVTHGTEILFESSFDQEGNIGFWTDKDEWISWSVDVPKKGQYKVEILAACPEDTAGTSVSLDLLKKNQEETQKQLIKFQVKPTQDFAAYKRTKIGVISLNAGKVQIALKPLSKPSFAVMNLKKLTLIRQNDSAKKK